MSQIPRSQFALKKRQQTSTPTATIPVLAMEHQSSEKPRKNHSNGSSNGSSGNGHKTGNYDNEVVIIDDDCFGIVQNEEIVTTMEEQFTVDPSPTKKKRSRRSKDSTSKESAEPKDSEVAKKVEEEQTTKSPSKKPSKVDDAFTQPEESKAETKTKVVKLTSEALTGSKGRRSNRLENASTIVNVSSISISEQSTKVLQDDSLESTPPTERRVSGRRSTRPIDDIKFTYRTPNPDDSLNETTNATIGSDPNSDSLLTTPGTDRKRRQINESMESIDSPKRSRMDLSGLFASFSSPVNLLRNKFRRANIASTPIAVGKDALLNESANSEASSEMKEVDLEAKEEIACDGDKEELKVITTPIKKSKCSIM